MGSLSNQPSSNSPADWPKSAARQSANLEELAKRIHPARFDDLGWRHEQHLADRVREHHEACGKRVEALRIIAREFRHFPFGAAAPNGEIFALVQRQEVLHSARNNGEPVLAKRHLGNDFGVQQRDGIARGRIPETRREFLGNRGSAYDAAPFEHEHLEARARAIEGADEAVVPASDDDDVVLPALQTRLLRRNLRTVV
jgi:hypothetical protein